MTLNQARPLSPLSLASSPPSELTPVPRSQFDKSASQALQKDVKAKANVKAQMRTYNHVMDVRRLSLSSFSSPPRPARS